MATPAQDLSDCVDIATVQNQTKEASKIQERSQGLVADIANNYKVGDDKFAAIDKECVDWLLNGFAVVKHQNGREYAHFVTTPPQNNGNTPGVHAEKKLLDKYNDNGNIQDIESIIMTYPPCSCCTVNLILAFWSQQNKPTIKYLYHNHPDPRIHKHARKNIELLEQHGFKIGEWSLEEMIQNVPEEIITDLKLLSKNNIDHIDYSKHIPSPCEQIT